MKVLSMEKYVELNSQGNVLRGMMHIPDGISGPVPFVILFHGFQDDRNEINFVHTELSRRLCQAGIGSVRFDFLGSGKAMEHFRISRYRKRSKTESIFWIMF